MAAGDDGQAMSTSTAARPSRPDVRSPRRALLPVSVLGGLAAALSPLVVLMAVGVVGWFVSDAGVHGTPRGGMRAGALAWLAAHGSGFEINGASITVIPLGLTLACAWTLGRVGHRVGVAVAGHGPDADRIGDGERDLTVPSAVGAFFGAYLVAALLVATLAGAGEVGADRARLVVACALLCAVVAAPAIAVGSGRAAIWAAVLPVPVRMGAQVAYAVVRAFALLGIAVFAVSLALHLDDAATVLAKLHTTAGEATLYSVISAAFVPNAALLTGAYLLGPGFEIGAGNVVTLAGVSLGPLPLFPLVAALPGAGAGQVWGTLLLGLPAVVAALATVRTLRRGPVLRWDHSLLAATGGGLVAALAVTVLTSFAGGSAGPGRMRTIGAPTSEVLVHALTALGVGALLGALVVVALARVSREETRG